MLYYDMNLDKLIVDASVDIETRNMYYLEEGEKKGMKKGKKIGLEKGEQIGIEKSNRAMIINMKKEGLSTDTIAKCAGKSIEYVHEVLIKEKNKNIV